MSLILIGFIAKAQEMGFFTDTRDGKVYKTVKIGNQTWMAENLAYLPLVCPPEERCGYWVYDYIGPDVKKAKTTDSYKVYGVLYNYKAAATPCPAGWHLSSDADWTVMEKSLGLSGWIADDIRGKLQKIGTKLKSKEGWKNNGNGTNESGSNAVPTGTIISEWNEEKEQSNIRVENKNLVATFWTSTYNGKKDWCQKLTASFDWVTRYLDSDHESKIHSVRCVKDEK